MQSDLPWNVPGISADAREAARAAARREGLSLGEWLTRRIETNASAEAGAEMPANDAAPDISRPLTAYPASGAALDKALADAGLDLGEFAHGMTEGPADQETAGICLQIEEQLQILSDTLTGSGTVNETQGHPPYSEPPHDFGAISRLEAQLDTLSHKIDHIAALAENPPPAPLPPIPVAGQLENLTALLSAQADRLSGTELQDAIKTLQRSLAGLDEHMGASSGRVGTRLAELAKDLLVVTGKIDRLHADFLTQGRAVPTSAPGLQADFSGTEGKSAADMAAALMRPAGDDAPASPRWKKYALATSVTLVLLAGGLGTIGWIAMPPAWQAALLSPFQQGTARQAAAVPPDTVAHDLAAKARSGDAKAALTLGLRYADSGDKTQMAEAVKWLQLAAQEGEPSAQYRLADLYAHGAGVTADPVKAANLFLAAASDSNRQAMYQLASAYATGSGVKQDDAAAAHWFQMAASAGSTDAAFNLAVLYERGGGLPQNLKEAYKWYAIAAAQGDTEAKARLPVVAGQLTDAARHNAEDEAAAFRPTSSNTLPLPAKP